MTGGQDGLDFAATLADASAEALGDACLGVILHGSLVLGDYRPGTSDIDLLAIVDRALSDHDFRALESAVREHDPRAPGPVDLHVLTQDMAETPISLPPVEAILEIHPGRPLHVERHRAPDRDLVIELSVCRSHGRALVGADPRQLIGKVPDEWVMEVGDAVLADWQAIGDDPEHAVLTVLTTCRIWRFALEQRHCSKVAAAEWALDRDPSVEVVRHALRVRSGNSAEPLDPSLVAALLATTRARIGAG